LGNKILIGSREAQKIALFIDGQEYGEGMRKRSIRASTGKGNYGKPDICSCLSRGSRKGEYLELGTRGCVFCRNHVSTKLIVDGYSPELLSRNEKP
jgi:hypothetical protein